MDESCWSTIPDSATLRRDNDTPAGEQSCRCAPVPHGKKRSRKSRLVLVVAPGVPVSLIDNGT